jgi:hypothetical protein
MDQRLRQLPPDVFPPGFVDNLPSQARVPEKVPELKFGLKDFRPKENILKRIMKVFTPLSVYFWIMVFLVVVGILINKFIVNHWFVNTIYILVSVFILFS